ncbi:MAG: HemK2/MTQ2 family protein methyltransferase [Ferruginibacter sp.]
MNTVLKHIVAHTYKPMLVKYLSKTRMYRYKDIRLAVAPEVFHPGFFFSTTLLLKYMSRLSLHEKKVLELGCGSGLISIVAAKNGAKVTATDINPVAVEFLKKNSRQNKVELEIIQSDLFKNIPKQPFNIIAINPPYYKKQPATIQDHAWFCGENGEYFSALFNSIDNYIHDDTEILMVLFESFDMEMITGFAAKNGFVLNCVYSKKNMLERNFIFKIEKIK